jgi:hypothetical protein
MNEGSTTNCSVDPLGPRLVSSVSVVVTLLMLFGCSNGPLHRDDGLPITQVKDRMSALPHMASAAVAIETTTDGTPTEEAGS